MTQGDEDKAWQDIVAGWSSEPAAGDAPDIESLPAEQVDAPPETPANPAYDPVPFHGFADPADERFVPPVPERMPLPTPPRLIAWCGVLGGPALFLILLLVGASLPSWASALLIAGFVGGFLFLVATMRNEPRDPGDNGAVV